MEQQVCKNLRRAIDLQLGQAVHGHAYQTLPQQCRQADPENRQGQTRRHLIGLQGQGQEAEDQRQCRAAQRRHQQRQAG